MIPCSPNPTATVAARGLASLIAGGVIVILKPQRLRSLVPVAVLCLSGLADGGPPPAGSAASALTKVGNGMSIPQADPKIMKRRWADFRQTQGASWSASWDARTGLPRMIHGGRTRAYSGVPLESTRAFVRDHEPLLGLDAVESSLRHLETRPVFGGHRVAFRQTHRGIDVFDARLLLLVDARGRVFHVTSSVWPVREVSLEPVITAQDAIARVEAHLGRQAAKTAHAPSLVIFTKGAGALAYLLMVRVGPQSTPWRFIIDAATGDVLDQRRLVQEESPGARRAGEKARGGSDEPRGPVPPGSAQLMGGSFLPCDRQWEIDGHAFPLDEVQVLERGMPSDPYDVDVLLAVSSFGAGTGPNNFQDGGYYGALMWLLPCKEYTIKIDWDLATWDSYNAAFGFFDHFAVNVNSTFPYRGYWLDEIGSAFCSTGFDDTGSVVPGTTWFFGGDNWNDNSLCTSIGNFEFTYDEGDSTKDIFLSVALASQGGHVGGSSYPSWGTIGVEILAPTHVFDPNPVTTLNDASLVDSFDWNSAVPCGGYVEVNLSNLNAPGLSGYYVLTGAYADIQDIETPSITPPQSRNQDFSYIRFCDEFEAVMAYHHITQNQLYIQSLGYFGVNNRSHPIDAHGLDNADNSYYVGSPIGAGYVAFGDGGVDDAEDADVILHEYGHSIQDNQTLGVYFGNGNIGFGDETGAMGEGFGDYWACSAFYAQSLSSGFDPAAFAEWDAQNGAGLRRVDGTKHYPEGMANEVHDDGEIWSATLWELFNALSKDVTDHLVLDSHSLVPTNPTFCDGAKALLAADQMRYSGVHVGSVVDVYLDRGIFESLLIGSQPAGALVTMSPGDVQGIDGGLAPFGAAHCYAGLVTVTAAPTHAGVAFQEWVLDGVPLGVAVPTLEVSMTSSHTLEAIYGQVSCQWDCQATPNGAVDVPDLLALLATWGAPGPCDFDASGTVVVPDLLKLLANWGPCP